ncbi:MAG: AmmeMemoRadiSam system protein A [Selenomonas sp.]|uniref:AmmeMemoRadiSam system protein A n=1 Tax=Selenomonas sp. TaxID=2053611 RepID=UPI0025EDDC9A|nr:AmmeMemoRadiSam system protein A [Selenomonas sp.]MCR5757924.1 AmmeMemoRadiSam system protein A [Selenomonas sp.]
MGLLGACVVPHPPLIIPEIGRGEERGISATIAAYKKAAQWAVEKQPDLIVITSPHAKMYADYLQVSAGAGAKGSFAAFGHPEVSFSVAYDEEFVAGLSVLADEIQLPAGTLGKQDGSLDHGTMIPLYFLQEVGYRGRIVRIGLAGISQENHYALGVLLTQVAERLGRRMVLVASGDLSHKLKADGPYGFDPAGPVFDERMGRCFREGDFLKLLTTPAEMADRAAECGLRSFWIMAGALDRRQVKSQLLSLEGPFGVGYAVAIFNLLQHDESRNLGEQAAKLHQQEMVQLREKEDVYLSLARYSLEHFVRTGQRAAVPENLPAELTRQRAGAFVSIKKDGQLRGCIGTILPVRDNLAQEILANAVSAGTGDPRFSPVTEAELGELVYDVDVLSAPEPIAGMEMLDVKRYGVIVESADGSRRGLLLPDLAGVDTVEQQVDIARKKGNIASGEQIKLWRFTVTRHVVKD